MGIVVQLLKASRGVSAFRNGGPLLALRETMQMPGCIGDLDALRLEVK